MELLNSEDMTSLLDKAQISMAGEQPAAMDAMFETWGMEPEAVVEIVNQGAYATAQISTFSSPEGLAKAMFDTTVVGFVLGCMATIEVETRKQTGENNA